MAPASYLFYFDQAFLTIEGRVQSLEIAADLLRALIRNGNQAMVVSSGDVLTTYTPLTDDLDLLLSALDVQGVLNHAIVDDMLATMMPEDHFGIPPLVCCGRVRDICEDLMEVCFPEPICGDLGEIPKALLALLTRLPTVAYLVGHGIELDCQVCGFPCVKRATIPDTRIIGAVGEAFGDKADMTQWCG